jgi:iron complex outermembrane receptor protein
MFIKDNVLGFGVYVCTAFYAGILSGSDGAFAQSSSAPTDVGQVKDVIVTTGTREVTKKALDSISPVDVITGAQLQQTGETTLRDALVKLAPSIGRQSMAWVAANLTSAFTLRGLGPNYVLVLVNGKRRHPTANMTTGEGPQQGSTGADIDLIPVGAIDHIEVLRDGAAAQYGSDAIAGVVNIILKSRNHGGSISTTDGQTYQGDGLSSDGAADVGLPIGERGFAYLSADVQHKDHTVRSGIDTQTNAQSNLSLGDPSLDRQAVAVNAGYELTDDIELYGFGTFAHRDGESYQNYRLASVAPTVYPFGFSPIVEVDENDYSATIGAKGNNLAGWHWDISSTLGGDNVDVGTVNNINLNLFNATGNAQSSFNLGRYQDSQWTNNLDVGRPITLPWLLAPSELSLGVEQRIETYEVGAAEAAALYGTGTQALQGQSQLSAGSYSRNVLATYIDLATHLSSKWQVDMAGRVEHYSDVGNTANAKLSTRYDFTPQVAVRGAVSTGFRAPSLAQEHYSSLTISPTTAIGLLSNDSAAARALGAAPLKPEKSDNFDLGFVLRPLSNLDVTIDAYRIDIRDRIIEGSAYSGQTAINALNEAGLALPAGLSSVSTYYFSNGVNTTTQGLDIAATYRTEFAVLGRIDWDLAANFNHTNVTHIGTDQNGTPILNAQTLGWITSATPSSKIVAGGNWLNGKWGASLHVTRYGSTSSEATYYSGPNAYSTTNFYHFVNTPKYITDVEARYAVTKQLLIAIGAENLFNVHPSRMPADTVLNGALQYDAYASAIGIDGGFYYVRAVYRF